MPLSAVIQLEALNGGTLDQFSGRGVHGFWFERWRQVDPATGDRLHAQPQDAPFSLSPLLGLPARRGGLSVQAGQPAWLRITCLEEELEAAFLEKWLPGVENGSPLELPSSDPKSPAVQWKILPPASPPAPFQPFATQATYQEMSRQSLLQADPPRQWRLEFLSPTTFNTGRTTEGKDNHLPFPLPESLVKSWLRRWQVFAPMALPEEDLLAWARTNLAVSAYRLQAQPVREGERLRVGCTGRMSLRALDMPPYLRAILDLLAHYALFCGSGSHTTQGLGQTRLLPSC
jgi:CRISPR-associated endoribonuclease Cas6